MTAHGGVCREEGFIHVDVVWLHQTQVHANMSKRDHREAGTKCKTMKWIVPQHSFDWCSRWLQRRCWLCCSCDPLYNKEVHAAGPYCIVGQRCHPWLIFPTGSQWNLRVDLAGICVRVCVFSLVFLFFACAFCLRACVCAPAHVCTCVWPIVARHLPTGSLSDWWISVFKVSLKKSIVCLCSAVLSILSCVSLRSLKRK